MFSEDYRGYNVTLMENEEMLTEWKTVELYEEVPPANSS
jgi:hypothetical protein